MQWLKEDVKNRILESALKEFSQKGFIDASMRRIAHNAGVALGNVYRYFKSKDELFNSIMEPAFKECSVLLDSLPKPRFTNDINYTISVNEVVDMFMKVYNTYKTEFLTMINKSKGTRFENVKEDFVKLIESRIKSEMVPQLKEKKIEIEDEFIIYILSSNTIEGIRLIINKYDDNERIRYLVSQLVKLNFENIVERLKS
jgi:AcrR family transcriptional regulator